MPRPAPHLRTPSGRDSRRLFSQPERLPAGHATSRAQTPWSGHSVSRVMPTELPEVNHDFLPFLGVISGSLPRERSEQRQRDGDWVVETQSVSPRPAASRVPLSCECDESARVISGVDRKLQMCRMFRAKPLAANKLPARMNTLSNEPISNVSACFVSSPARWSHIGLE